MLTVLKLNNLHKIYLFDRHCQFQTIDLEDRQPLTSTLSILDVTSNMKQIQRQLTKTSKTPKYFLFLFARPLHLLYGFDQCRAICEIRYLSCLIYNAYL